MKMFRQVDLWATCPTGQAKFFFLISSPVKVVLRGRAKPLEALDVYFHLNTIADPPDYYNWCTVLSELFVVGGSDGVYRWMRLFGGGVGGVWGSSPRKFERFPSLTYAYRIWAFG